MRVCVRLVSWRRRLPAPQADHIKALQHQLSAATASTDGTLQKQLAAARRRNKALEAQLQHADEALAKKHPDSLANLIRAAKPGPEAAEAVRSLRARVAELEAAEAETQATHRKRVAALRQESDKMRKTLQQQVEDAQEAAKAEAKRAEELAALTKSTAAADVRKQADAEIRRIREFYHNKLKQKQVRWCGWLVSEEEARGGRGEVCVCVGGCWHRCVAPSM